MFNKNKFMALLKENDISIEQLAGIIGVSKTTLYRKINGESDFYRSEIQAIATVVPNAKIETIFFA